MQIAPEIVARHWEAAAAEQLARNLRREGYEVSRGEGVAASRTPSIVARRGNEVTVYGVKAVPWDEDQAEELVRLRDQAVDQLGAGFRLVFVTPPQHELAAEVQGLDRILLGRLTAPLPSDVAASSDCTTLDSVSDLEIASIAVRPPEISLRGTGVVHATLRWNRDGAPETERDSFPLAFEVTLDTHGGLIRAERLDVDVGQWRAPDRDAGERADAAATSPPPADAPEAESWHGDW
jgi:hypothetical protein